MIGIAEYLWGDYRQTGVYWSIPVGASRYLSCRVMWWPFGRDDDEQWTAYLPLKVTLRHRRMPRRKVK